MQDYAERRALRGELKLLAKEERSRQQKAVGECLARAGVVCATLTGCLSRDLAPRDFDLAVVDEAAQVMSLACMAQIRPGRLADWGTCVVNQTSFEPCSLAASPGTWRLETLTSLRLTRLLM